MGVVTVGSDIPLGVSARQAVALKQQRLDCGRQIVAQLLAALRQMRVAQREPALLLDDPKPFAGPIEVGVDDPQAAK